MDFTFILGLVLGALASLGITHLYYKRSSVDQELLYRKLSTEVRCAILDDSRENLSIPELNQLLDDKTIDRDTSGHPLPFKACPKCGSEDLERKEVLDERHDEMYYFIGCKQCGWGDSTQ
jgi:predicted RNA-binding Zn-ribbon protein involved in translation (DUF1610 family)